MRRSPADGEVSRVPLGFFLNMDVDCRIVYTPSSPDRPKSEVWIPWSHEHPKSVAMTTTGLNSVNTPVCSSHVESPAVNCPVVKSSFCSSPVKSSSLTVSSRPAVPLPFVPSLAVPCPFVTRPAVVPPAVPSPSVAAPPCPFPPSYPAVIRSSVEVPPVHPTVASPTVFRPSSFGLFPPFHPVVVCPFVPDPPVLRPVFLLVPLFVPCGFFLLSPPVLVFVGFMGGNF